MTHEFLHDIFNEEIYQNYLVKKAIQKTHVLILMHFVDKMDALRSESVNNIQKGLIMVPRKSLQMSL